LLDSLLQELDGLQIIWAMQIFVVFAVSKERSAR